MGIDATSSSTVSSSTSASQVSSASNSDSAKKTSTDSSFKDEMSKVESSESKKEDKSVEKSSEKANAESAKNEKESASQDNLDEQNDLFAGTLNGAIDYNQFGSKALNDANLMLSNDIQQMMNSTSQLSALSETSAAGSIFSFDGLDSNNSISMTQSDAQFFINLTQNNDVSMQNVIAQGQTLLNNGAVATEVKQNVQISQTLLNALNTARETNQPLRIDFDQNVSVILRIGKDGALAANFIPGDKAVEQYLKNNIETLKATFRENDLPYSDLSYSNSSKQQNERRRNKQQQGEQ